MKERAKETGAGLVTRGALLLTGDVIVRPFLGWSLAKYRSLTFRINEYTLPRELIRVCELGHTNKKRGKLVWIKISDNLKITPVQHLQNTTFKSDGAFFFPAGQCL